MSYDIILSITIPIVMLGGGICYIYLTKPWDDDE